MFCIYLALSALNLQQSISIYVWLLQEADDNDYQTEDSASDNTDSDIDLDENDEVKSDAEDAGGENKRKRRLVTKAYRVN